LNIVSIWFDLDSYKSFHKNVLKYSEKGFEILFKNNEMLTQKPKTSSKAIKSIFSSLQSWSNSFVILLKNIIPTFSGKEQKNFAFSFCFLLFLFNPREEKSIFCWLYRFRKKERKNRFWEQTQCILVIFPVAVHVCLEGGEI